MVIHLSFRYTFFYVFILGHNIYYFERGWGSCVELKSQGKSLILDLGIPLVNPDGSSFDDRNLKLPINELLENKLLPSIPGLYGEGYCDVAGILISHAHMDHYGLAQFVRPDVPIYVTEGTATLINISNIFLPHVNRIQNLVNFPNRWEPVQIGPF